MLNILEGNDVIPQGRTNEGMPAELVALHAYQFSSALCTSMGSPCCGHLVSMNVLMALLLNAVCLIKQ